LFLFADPRCQSKLKLTTNNSVVVVVVVVAGIVVVVVVVAVVVVVVNAYIHGKRTPDKCWQLTADK